MKVTEEIDLADQCGHQNNIYFSDSDSISTDSREAMIEIIVPQYGSLIKRLEV